MPPLRMSAEVQAPGPTGGPVRYVLAGLAAALFLAAAMAVAAALQRLSPAAAVSAALSSDQLFDPVRVWNVHLKFTAEQWAALEPKRGPGFPGGPGGPPPGTGPPAGGPPGPGGPGGPPPGTGPPAGGPPAAGGPGGPPGGFGPGTFIAPVMLRQGDTDGDGSLSREEFAALGDTWFTAWDKGTTGSLNGVRLRDGLNRTLAPPAPLAPPGPATPAGAPAPPTSRMSFQGPEGKRNGVLAVMGIELPSVRADLDFDGLVVPEVSVRYKGNGSFLQSRGTPKRSLKVDLNRGFRGRKFGGATKLNLHSNVTDAGYMNEVVAYGLYRAAGVPAPRTTYARVYVTVPGTHDRQYIGLYSLVENLDNSFAVNRFGTRKGALFKPVPRRLFEDLGNDWAAYRQAYDVKTPISPEESRRVIDFSRLVSHADDAEFAARVEDFLDLEEFASFMAVSVWISTLDSILAMGQNYVVYLHPTTQRFQFIPWDLDHAFGQFFPIGTPEQRENLSLRKPWAGDNLFLDRIFRLEHFQRLYRTRLRELNETICRPERIQRRVDELAAVLRPAVQDESAEKLARFDRVVAGEAMPPAGFGGPPPGGSMPAPTHRPPGPPASAASGPGVPPGGPGGGSPVGPPVGPAGFAMPATKPIKGFVVARWASVRDQLAGTTAGMTVEPFGVGGPGGGPVPEGLGPGLFLGPIFLAKLDEDQSGEVTRAEFAAGFRRWFAAWDKDQTATLDQEQLREGLNTALNPFPNGPPGGPGAGAPGSLGGGGLGPPPGTATGPALEAATPAPSAAPATPAP